MFDTVAKDIKNEFESGSVLTRIIIVNLAIFVLSLLVIIFFQGKSGIEQWFGLSPKAGVFLLRPWSIISHMFLHVGFWHFFWNMLLLYWFGNLLKDFSGDRGILNIYLLGGLGGAALYVLSFNIFPSLPLNTFAYGASAAVMAIIFSLATFRPDYQVNLLLIGPVKIKFIALFLLLLDLATIAGQHNTGGHIAHIGGAVTGWLYTFYLGKGVDIGKPIDSVVNTFSGWYNKMFKTQKGPTLVYKDPEIKKKVRKGKEKFKDGTEQEVVDKLLEKIKRTGYDSLSDEEKEFLFRISNK